MSQSRDIPPFSSRDDPTFSSRDDPPFSSRNHPPNSSRNHPPNTSRDQPVTVSGGETYVTIKKRVGGGFKYVKLKVTDNSAPVGKRKEETEKHETEQKEKFDKTKQEEYDFQVSEESSFESMKLPVSPSDLRRKDSCDGKVRYDDYPILRYIQDGVIGNNIEISGPFGTKKVVYCDYTASGRSLSFIEDYMRHFVFPFYANTHSETGRNARQTAKFREDARSIIRKCVNAGKDDVVIFTGSGATAGFHKVAWGLKIHQPRVAEETVVLTGPYEHHSNILIWKELGATLVRIRDGSDGNVDMGHLISELKFWKDKRRLVLVFMSAASNVTGIVTNTEEVARIAHQHGALAAFDYAGGGPYLKIDMNPAKHSHKDAVFLSPHKFVGGPGTPGVLVAKRWMFRNHTPDRVGGGTVVYVSRDTHMYTSDIEAREEGGTPAILESIRTGLAFKLKQAVGESLIAARDDDLCCRAFSVWERNPQLVVLGSHVAERVTIFSFVVRHEHTNKFIHYNFISTLLNDLFGIQSRGGCACAGPYGLDLLGITEPMAKRINWFVSEQPGMDSAYPQQPLTVMKPGFCRINLPYFYDDETVDYVIRAVDLVATHGWKLLPQYTFNPHSGAFVYKGEVTGEAEEGLYSLADIDLSSSGKCHVNRHPPSLASDVTLQQMMSQAEAILEDTKDHKKDRQSSATARLLGLIPKDRRRLRWFLTPQEATDVMTGAKRVKRYRPVMVPRYDVNRTRVDSGIDTDHSHDDDLGGTIGSKNSDVSKGSDVTNKATRRRVVDKNRKLTDNNARDDDLGDTIGSKTSDVSNISDVISKAARRGNGDKNRKPLYNSDHNKDSKPGPRLDRPKVVSKLGGSGEDNRVTEMNDVKRLDLHKHHTVNNTSPDILTARAQKLMNNATDDSDWDNKDGFGTARREHTPVVFPKVTPRVQYVS